MMDTGTRRPSGPRHALRTVPRRALFVTVRWGDGSRATLGGELYAGISMNISEGGIFVATHALRPKGTWMEVEFSLWHRTPHIHALVDVCWTREWSESSDAPPGMGLRFRAIKDEDLAQIRKYVRSSGAILLYEGRDERDDLPSATAQVR